MLLIFIFLWVTLERCLLKMCNAIRPSKRSRVGHKLVFQLRGPSLRLGSTRLGTKSWALNPSWGRFSVVLQPIFASKSSWVCKSCKSRVDISPKSLISRTDCLLFFSVWSCVEVWIPSEKETVQNCANLIELEKRGKEVYFLPLYSSIEFQLQNRLRYSREGALQNLANPGQSCQVARFDVARGAMRRDRSWCTSTAQRPPALPKRRHSFFSFCA